MKINIFNTFEEAKQAQEYDHLYQIEECEQNICKQEIIDNSIEECVKFEQMQNDIKKLKRK